MISDPTHVVIRFYRALDEGDSATLAGLLAADGEWHRRGVVLRNRADIDAAMEGRSQTRRIHHLLTNLYAEADGADGVQVVGYMAVVQSEPLKGDGDGPAPLTGIDTLQSIRALLRRTEAGWRIVRLTGDEPAFVAPHLMA